MSNSGNVLRGVIADLQAKLTRRHGDYGIHRAFRAIACASDLAEARAELSELSARMSDEAFDALAGNGVSVGALTQALCLAVPPMRKVVMDAAWSALCGRALGGLPPRNPGGIAAMTLGTDFLQAQYDVSRFVEIKNGVITAEQAVADFCDAFPAGRADPVTADEFIAFCCGVSLQRPADQKLYELHVVRSWNLDRGVAVGGAAAAAADADKSAPRAAEASSSQGRSHPLYQTSSAKVGVGASEGASKAVVQFHRAGRFTKENPPPTPSCGLNTGGTTRGRFM